MRRRRLLGLSAAGTLGAAAGCLGGGDAPGESDGASGGDADGGNESTGDGGSDDESGDGEDGSAWPTGTYADYETTTVTVEGTDGAERGSVTAALADTRQKRFLGLSDAESLPEDGGMLFVYDAPKDSLTYVMREMDFGIDIVYVDGDRNIVEIHNAPEPGPNEDGEQQRYPGSGQYVLEVPYEWTDRHGVSVGDSLAFDL
ncbi:DUF192 domain-containing protein [Halorubrum sp. Atlit-8R]|uniref:DUF192 domain-containing protein n=1 Tax=unclassified Halorubrum TaxID=2642239 RepID=UPI000EF1BCBC|nr:MULTISPECIES: DUF192 domain-containing protein [unclassified Halorubrum]RLM63495.1 DUF192 domain-containing protein [Halorubrum sp. Atlit-9R]RLM76972.1 DUF192 domain-containing protein [Halorubrum sp. Atlit-8R]